MQTPLITQATVRENVLRCREHYSLSLAVADFPEAHPGQFVHLTAPLEPQAPRLADWAEGPGKRCCLEEDLFTVRRAYSVAGLQRERGECVLQILYRTTGRFTHWLAKLAPGAELNVLGPLGNQFTLPAGRSPALLVAGGVGLPPLLFWAAALQRRGVEVVGFCGARSADLLPLQVERSAPHDAAAPGLETFSAPEFGGRPGSLIVATDDGSLGRRGTVADALEAYLDARPAPGTQPVAYTCGPEPMMRRVSEICAVRSIECQVCMERSMACGMGTCQSCVVATVSDQAPGAWRYRLCCTDGPIFDSRTILWRVPASHCGLVLERGEKAC